MRAAKATKTTTTTTTTKNTDKSLEVIELCQNHPLGPPESKKYKKDAAHSTRNHFYQIFVFDPLFLKLI